MRSSLIAILCVFVIGCGGSSSDDYAAETVDEFNREITKLNSLADEGDDLWESGDKQRAVDFYLQVIASSRLDSDSPAIFDDDFDVSKITKPEFDPQVILTRVAEYQIAAGQTVQAEQTFVKALDCELALNLATPEANAAFAEAKARYEEERSRRYGGSIDDAFNRGSGVVSDPYDDGQGGHTSAGSIGQSGNHGDQRTILDFLSSDERTAFRSPIIAENIAEAYKKRTNKGTEYVNFTRGNTGQFYFDGQKTKSVGFYTHHPKIPQMLQLPDETEWRDQTIWFTQEGRIDMYRMPDRSKWKYNDN